MGAQTIVAILSDLGAIGFIMYIFHRLTTHTIPRIRGDCDKALAQARTDFMETLDRQRQDFKEELSRQRKDYMDAMHRDREWFSVQGKKAP